MKELSLLDPAIILPVVAFVAPVWAFMHFMGQVSQSGDRRHAANFAFLCHGITLGMLYVLPEKKMLLFSPSLAALQLVCLFSLIKSLPGRPGLRTIILFVLTWGAAAAIYIYCPELLLHSPTTSRY